MEYCTDCVVLAFKWINRVTGRCPNVPHSMIYPPKETCPNPHVVMSVPMKHVTFHKYVFHLQALCPLLHQTSVPVNTTPHPLFHPDGPTEMHTVRGTRLVVISARAQWDYKVSRKVALHMPHFRGEPRALYPGFGAGRPTSFVEHAEDPIASDPLS